MFLTQLVVYYVFLNIIQCQNWRERRPTVKVEQGVLEGKRIITDAGKIVNAFLGIPYAEPPIGDLRFAPPQSHSPWNETWKADNFGARCPQLPIKPGVNDQEDCLYLNIWAPENRGPYATIPVVVFFEGKNFFQSSESPINGQDLASEGLVIVTMNYRLNVFGFFCLGSWEARGNLGLLDQYFALLWIRENIKHFGGDREKLTLYGHQSGAVSVTFHMTSPRAAGYFQRVVLSSGSAVTPWQQHNDPIVASKQILRMLRCDAYTINPIKCLRAKKVEDILSVLGDYSDSFNWNDKFLPVVDTFLPEDDRYLPSDPAMALKVSKLQVPILTGISKPIVYEQIGQWLEYSLQGYSQLLQYIEKAKIPEITRMYKFSPTNEDEIFDLIRWQYFSSNQGHARALLEELKNFEFQAKIEAPHFLQLSHLISSYMPIYVYYMDEIDGFGLHTNDSTITTDLLLIFGPILLKQVARRRAFNEHEMRWSRQIKQMWIDFIIFGNPTPNNQQRTWRKYTANDLYVENFGPVAAYAEEENKKRVQRVAFWNQLIPKITAMKHNSPNNIPRELQNSPDPAAGFRHAMYTLVGLVIALLALLLICIVLLKKRSKERESHLHMGY